MRSKAFSWPASVIAGVGCKKWAAGPFDASYSSQSRRTAGAASPRAVSQSPSGMSPVSQPGASGSRCANARVMLVPQSLPCLAAW
eukprot:9345356-Lingulodinium_polyedra.AAC.1